jgi:hypothetical protein
VVVRAQTASSRCPVGGAPSVRLHSCSVHQLADLSSLGVAVRLQLQGRHFFCDQPLCRRDLCTARLPGVAEPSARAVFDRS